MTVRIDLEDVHKALAAAVASPSDCAVITDPTAPGRPAWVTVPDVRAAMVFAAALGRAIGDDAVLLMSGAANTIDLAIADKGGTTGGAVVIVLREIEIVGAEPGRAFSHDGYGPPPPDPGPGVAAVDAYGRPQRWHRDDMVRLRGSSLVGQIMIAEPGRARVAWANGGQVWHFFDKMVKADVLAYGGVQRGGPCLRCGHPDRHTTRGAQAAGTWPELSCPACEGGVCRHPEVV
jgi:hypothetical protein